MIVYVENPLALKIIYHARNRFVKIFFVLQSIWKMDTKPLNTDMQWLSQYGSGKRVRWNK